VILCASELAANAALHSDSRLPGGTFTLPAEISRGHHARIEIEDNGGPWTSATADSTEPLAAGQREVSPLWGGSLARCLKRRRAPVRAAAAAP
jgi:anti-sigma regulatory factor (Ser/Thr protein kinase)